MSASRDAGADASERDAQRAFRELIATAYGGRPAVDGEQCPCGRQAAVVFHSPTRDEGVRWCGGQPPLVIGGSGG